MKIGDKVTIKDLIIGDVFECKNYFKGLGILVVKNTFIVNTTNISTFIYSDKIKGGWVDGVCGDELEVTFKGNLSGFLKGHKDG